MERFNFNCSTKNIPMPTNKEYLKRLIEMTEKLINRMRWRAYHFLNSSSESDHRETYGFNSKKTPPQVPELNEFEAKMTNLIQNIEFKDLRSTEFQNELSKHVESMSKDNNLYVPADETTNFYKMNASDYNTLLKKNIEKEYRKAPDNAEMHINTEAKAFAQTLKIDDRVEKLAPKESFITLKDHKDNFLNNPTCRLINPTKSELGKVSKQILDKINETIIRKTHVHQWKNTRATLDWFINIPNKDQHSFIAFDIVNFYPSISHKLLEDALSFAAPTPTFP